MSGLMCAHQDFDFGKFFDFRFWGIARRIGHQDTLTGEVVVPQDEGLQGCALGEIRDRAYTGPFHTQLD